jgi:hypothetical protein
VPLVLAPQGIKRTLNLIETSARLAAEARREGESLVAALSVVGC